MINVSVVILAKNEESNILDCLEGLSEFDEIIIVDDNSTDRTLEVVKKLKDKRIKIVEHDLNGDFSKQRSFGMKKAKNDWVLFVDADERVPESLVKEIESRIQNENVIGYFIVRKDVMWGRKLIYGETGDIKLLRLGKRNKGEWVGKVHEVWRIDGVTDQLQGELLHYPHPTIGEFLSEINTYSTIRAKELREDGISVSALDIILYPKAKFLINYFGKLGFLDKMPGLVVASMMSFHSFLVRAKLWLSYRN